MKLKQYNENEYFQVSRGKIVGNWTEEDWVNAGNQCWDLITTYTDDINECTVPCKDRRENGHYVKECHFACPVCGSAKYRQDHYNHICYSSLAGARGYYQVCEDCGYSHNVILEMS